MKETDEIKKKIKELRKEERAEICDALKEGILKYGLGSMFRIATLALASASIAAGILGNWFGCIGAAIMTAVSIGSDIGDNNMFKHGKENSLAELREDGAAYLREIPYIRKRYREKIAAVKEGRDIEETIPHYDLADYPPIEPEQDGLTI